MHSIVCRPIFILPCTPPTNYHTTVESQDFKEADDQFDFTTVGDSNIQIQLCTCKTYHFKTFAWKQDHILRLLTSALTIGNAHMLRSQQFWKYTFWYILWANHQLPNLWSWGLKHDECQRDTLSDPRVTNLSSNVERMNRWYLHESRAP